MKERWSCALSLWSPQSSPQSKHWRGGDVGLLAKLRMFPSLGWAPHPFKLHHTRKNNCTHSRAIFIHKMGRAILLNINKTWTRKVSPLSGVLKLGCLESWVRTHSGIPGALLCRAGSWAWIILVGAFQLMIFWFYEYSTWAAMVASSNGHQGHHLIANSTSPWGCYETPGPLGIPLIKAILPRFSSPCQQIKFLDRGIFGRS